MSGYIPQLFSKNLKYSNNPNTDQSGDKDKIEDNEPSGETPKDKVITYLTEVILRKTGENKVLPGAKFTIEGKTDSNPKPNAPVFITSVNFVKDDSANPAYYLLINGTYTLEAPKDESETHYNSFYKKDEDGNYQKFKRVTTINTKPVENSETNDSNETGKITYITDKDGLITFKGLGKGEYSVTETEAPAGFNKLREPITIKVDWEMTEAGINWIVQEWIVIQTFIRLFLTDYRHIKCHAEGNYFDDGQSSDLIKQIL